MTHALKDLDRLLRGDATRLADLKDGQIEVAEGRLPWLVIGLGLLYGLCMGVFALSHKDFDLAWPQTLSSMIKVPLLFGATLLVTFPSLYVFNTLVGSRLTLQSVWRLLLSGLAVMMAILSSLGPIVAFFSVSTVSYPFIVLLNVAAFALAGFLGLKFLIHTLHRLTIVMNEVQGAPVAAAAPSRGAIEAIDDRAMGANVRQVFMVWVLVFSMVGAQMSWVLRPFIAAPKQPFILLSPRESNFFVAVFHATVKMMAGG